MGDTGAEGGRVGEQIQNLRITQAVARCAQQRQGVLHLQTGLQKYMNIFHPSSHKNEGGKHQSIFIPSPNEDFQERPKQICRDG